MTKTILVINSGSSSIKFSIYASSVDLNLFYHGTIDISHQESILSIINDKHEQILSNTIPSIVYSDLFKNIFDWFYSLPTKYTLDAVGHRVVHGGTNFVGPVIITPAIIQQIAELIPLAPLHQEHNLNAIKIVASLYPELTQIACFDTMFHRTMPPLAKLFALPRGLTETGIIRYGFHGISYEYIASIISDKVGEVGNKRVIVAHLGNGASMCAMHKRQSVATSMGFTALDGLMMGTRCGNVDPGAILYLIQDKQYTADQLLNILYQESGLLGVSGISSDMRELLISNNLHATEAIDLFCYRAALEIGSLSMALGGIDALIFTAGVGENAMQIRQKICTYLHWQGALLDELANTDNATIISAKDSSILIGVIPTNEELMIARHTQALIL